MNRLKLLFFCLVLLFSCSRKTTTQTTYAYENKQEKVMIVLYLLNCIEESYTPSTHKEAAMLNAMAEWCMDEREDLSFDQFMELEYPFCCLHCRSRIKPDLQCTCINYKSL